jgi:hypothetical protein
MLEQDPAAAQKHINYYDALKDLRCFSLDAHVQLGSYAKGEEVCVHETIGSRQDGDERVRTDKGWVAKTSDALRLVSKYQLLSTAAVTATVDPASKLVRVYNPRDTEDPVDPVMFKIVDSVKQNSAGGGAKNCASCGSVLMGGSAYCHKCGVLRVFESQASHGRMRHRTEDGWVSETAKDGTRLLKLLPLESVLRLQDLFKKFIARKIVSKLRQRKQDEYLEKVRIVQGLQRVKQARQQFSAGKIGQISWPEGKLASRQQETCKIMLRVEAGKFFPVDLYGYFIRAQKKQGGSVEIADPYVVVTHGDDNACRSQTSMTSAGVERKIASIQGETRPKMEKIDQKLAGNEELRKKIHSVCLIAERTHGTVCPCGCGASLLWSEKQKESLASMGWGGKIPKTIRQTLGHAWDTAWEMAEAAETCDDLDYGGEDTRGGEMRAKLHLVWTIEGTHEEGALALSPYGVLPDKASTDSTSVSNFPHREGPVRYLVALLSAKLDDLATALEQAKREKVALYRSTEDDIIQAKGEWDDAVHARSVPQKYDQGHQVFNWSFEAELEIGCRFRNAKPTQAPQASAQLATEPEPELHKAPGKTTGQQCSACGRFLRPAHFARGAQRCNDCIYPLEPLPAHRTRVEVRNGRGQKLVAGGTHDMPGEPSPGRRSH